MNIDDFNSHTLTKIRADVDLLYKTIYQGNGTPSLITQVSKLDNKIASVETKIDTNFKSIDNEMSLKFKNVTDVVNERFNLISYQILKEFEKHKIESTGRWTFKTGALTATVAGVCSLLAILISELVKRL